MWSRTILFDSLRSHLSSSPCPTRPLPPYNLSWGRGLQATGGPEQVWRVLKTRQTLSACSRNVPCCAATRLPYLPRYVVGQYSSSSSRADTVLYSLLPFNLWHRRTAAWPLDTTTAGHHTVSCRRNGVVPCRFLSHFDHLVCSSRGSPPWALPKPIGYAPRTYEAARQVWPP